MERFLLISELEVNIEKNTVHSITTKRVKSEESKQEEKHTITDDILVTRDLKNSFANIGGVNGHIEDGSKWHRESVGPTDSDDVILQDEEFKNENMREHPVCSMETSSEMLQTPSADSSYPEEIVLNGDARDMFPDENDEQLDKDKHIIRKVTEEEIIEEQTQIVVEKVLIPPSGDDETEQTTDTKEADDTEILPHGRKRTPSPDSEEEEDGHDKRKVRRIEHTERIRIVTVERKNKTSEGKEIMLEDILSSVLAGDIFTISEEIITKRVSSSVSGSEPAWSLDMEADDGDVSVPFNGELFESPKGALVKADEDGKHPAGASQEISQPKKHIPITFYIISGQKVTKDNIRNAIETLDIPSEQKYDLHEKNINDTLFLGKASPPAESGDEMVSPESVMEAEPPEEPSKQKKQKVEQEMSKILGEIGTEGKSDEIPAQKILECIESTPEQDRLYLLRSMIESALIVMEVEADRVAVSEQTTAEEEADDTKPAIPVVLEDKDEEGPLKVFHREITKPKGGYTFLPENIIKSRQWLPLRIQTEKKAKLALTTTYGNVKRDAYTVSFPTKKHKKLVIRDAKSDKVLGEVKSKDFVTKDHMTSFWIAWEETRITVGRYRRKGVNVMLQCTIPEKKRYPMNYLAVTTGDGPGEWQFLLTEGEIPKPKKSKEAPKPAARATDTSPIKSQLSKVKKDVRQIMDDISIEEQTTPKGETRGKLTEMKTQLAGLPQDQQQYLLRAMVESALFIREDQKDQTEVESKEKPEAEVPEEETIYPVETSPVQESERGHQDETIPEHDITPMEAEPLQLGQTPDQKTICPPETSPTEDDSNVIEILEYIKQTPKEEKGYVLREILDSVLGTGEQQVQQDVPASEELLPERSEQDEADNAAAYTQGTTTTTLVTKEMRQIRQEIELVLEQLPPSEERSQTSKELIEMKLKTTELSDEQKQYLLRSMVEAALEIKDETSDEETHVFDNFKQPTVHVYKTVQHELQNEKSLRIKFVPEHQTSILLAIEYFLEAPRNQKRYVLTAMVESLLSDKEQTKETKMDTEEQSPQSPSSNKTHGIQQNIELVLSGLPQSADEPNITTQLVLLKNKIEELPQPQSEFLLRALVEAALQMQEPSEEHPMELVKEPDIIRVSAAEPEPVAKPKESAEHVYETVKCQMEKDITIPMETTQKSTIMLAIEYFQVAPDEQKRYLLEKVVESASVPSETESQEDSDPSRKEVIHQVKQDVQLVIEDLPEATVDPEISTKVIELKYQIEGLPGSQKEFLLRAMVEAALQLQETEEPKGLILPDQKDLEDSFKDELPDTENIQSEELNVQFVPKHIIQEIFNTVQDKMETDVPMSITYEAIILMAMQYFYDAPDNQKRNVFEEIVQLAEPKTGKDSPRLQQILHAIEVIQNHYETDFPQTMDSQMAQLKAYIEALPVQYKVFLVYAMVETALHLQEHQKSQVEVESKFEPKDKTKKVFQTTKIEMEKQVTLCFTPHHESTILLAIECFHDAPPEQQYYVFQTIVDLTAPKLTEESVSREQEIRKVQQDVQTVMKNIPLYSVVPEVPNEVTQLKEPIEDLPDIQKEFLLRAMVLAALELQGPEESDKTEQLQNEPLGMETSEEPDHLPVDEIQIQEPTKHVYEIAQTQLESSVHIEPKQQVVILDVIQTILDAPEEEKKSLLRELVESALLIQEPAEDTDETKEPESRKRVEHEVKLILDQLPESRSEPKISKHTIELKTQIQDLPEEQKEFLLRAMVEAALFSEEKPGVDTMVDKAEPEPEVCGMEPAPSESEPVVCETEPPVCYPKPSEIEAEPRPEPELIPTEPEPTEELLPEIEIKEPTKHVYEIVQTQLESSVHIEPKQQVVILDVIQTIQDAPEEEKKSLLRELVESALLIQEPAEDTDETKEPEPESRKRVEQEINLVLEQLPESKSENKKSKHTIELKTQIQDLPEEQKEFLLRAMVEAALFSEEKPGVDTMVHKAEPEPEVCDIEPPVCYPKPPEIEAEPRPEPDLIPTEQEPTEELLPEVEIKEASHHVFEIVQSQLETSVHIEPKQQVVILDVIQTIQDAPEEEKKSLLRELVESALLIQEPAEDTDETKEPEPESRKRVEQEINLVLEQLPESKSENKKSKHTIELKTQIQEPEPESRKRVEQEINLVLEQLPESKSENKKSKHTIELKTQIQDLPEEQKEFLLRAMVEAALFSEEKPGVDTVVHKAEPEVCDMEPAPSESEPVVCETEPPVFYPKPPEIEVEPRPEPELIPTEPEPTEELLPEVEIKEASHHVFEIVQSQLETSVHIEPKQQVVILDVIQTIQDAPEEEKKSLLRELVESALLIQEPAEDTDKKEEESENIKCVHQEIELIMDRFPEARTEPKISKHTIELKTQIEDLPEEQKQFLLRAMVEAALSCQEPEPDIMVCEPQPDMVIGEPQPDIMVCEPQPDMVIGEPQPDIKINETEPDIKVCEPQPDMVIGEPQPDIMVCEPGPDNTISRPEPELMLSKREPDIMVCEPGPDMVISEPQPDIMVCESGLDNTISRPGPEPILSKCEPDIMVCEPGPAMVIGEPQPDIMVCEPGPDNTISKPEPELMLSKREPDIMVCEPGPDMVIGEPQPDIMVCEPGPDNTISGPEPELMLSEREPGVMVCEPQPDMVIGEPQPDIMVCEPGPDNTISKPEPELMLSKREPDIMVCEPGPDMVIGEPQPDIMVCESGPENTISKPEPELISSKREPDILVCEPGPDMVIGEAEPDIMVCEPGTDNIVNEPEPEIMLNKTDPDIMVCEPGPEIVTSEPKPEIVTSEPKPDIMVCEAEPTICDIEPESEPKTLEQEPEPEAEPLPDVEIKEHPKQVYQTVQTQLESSVHIEPKQQVVILDVIQTIQNAPEEEKKSLLRELVESALLIPETYEALGEKKDPEESKRVCQEIELVMDKLPSSQTEPKISKHTIELKSQIQDFPEEQKQFLLRAMVEAVISESMPTAIDQVPAVTETGPVVSEDEPTICEPEPNVSKEEPTICEPEPTVSKEEPPICEPKPTICEPEPTICEPEPTICEPEPTVSEPESTVSAKEPTKTEPALQETTIETEIFEPEKLIETSYGGIPEDVCVEGVKEDKLDIPEPVLVKEITNTTKQVYLTTQLKVPVDVEADNETVILNVMQCIQDTPPDERKYLLRQMIDSALINEEEHKEPEGQQSEEKYRVQQELHLVMETLPDAKEEPKTTKETVELKQAVKDFPEEQKTFLLRAMVEMALFCIDEETDSAEGETETTVHKPEPPKEPEPTVCEPEPTVCEPEPMIREPELITSEAEPTVCEPPPSVDEKENMSEPKPTVCEQDTNIQEGLKTEEINLPDIEIKKVAEYVYITTQADTPTPLDPNQKAIILYVVQHIHDTPPLERKTLLRQLVECTLFKPEDTQTSVEMKEKLFHAQQDIELVIEQLPEGSGEPLKSEVTCQLKDAVQEMPEEQKIFLLRAMVEMALCCKEPVSSETEPTLKTEHVDSATGIPRADELVEEPVQPQESEMADIQKGKVAEEKVDEDVPIGKEETTQESKRQIGIEEKQEVESALPKTEAVNTWQVQTTSDPSVRPERRRSRGKRVFHTAKAQIVRGASLHLETQEEAVILDAIQTVKDAPEEHRRFWLRELVESALVIQEPETQVQTEPKTEPSTEKQQEIQQVQQEAKLIVEQLPEGAMQPEVSSEFIDMKAQIEVLPAEHKTFLLRSLVEAALGVEPDEEEVADDINKDKEEGTPIPDQMEQLKEPETIGTPEHEPTAAVNQEHIEAIAEKVSSVVVQESVTTVLQDQKMPVTEQSTVEANLDESTELDKATSQEQTDENEQPEGDVDLREMVLAAMSMKVEDDHLISKEEEVPVTSAVEPDLIQSAAVGDDIETDKGMEPTEIDPNLIVTKDTDGEDLLDAVVSEQLEPCTVEIEALPPDIIQSTGAQIQEDDKLAQLEAANLETEQQSTLTPENIAETKVEEQNEDVVEIKPEEALVEEVGASPEEKAEKSEPELTTICDETKLVSDTEVVKVEKEFEPEETEVENVPEFEEPGYKEEQPVKGDTNKTDVLSKEKDTVGQMIKVLEDAPEEEKRFLLRELVEAALFVPEGDKDLTYTAEITKDISLTSDITKKGDEHKETVELELTPSSGDYRFIPDVIMTSRPWFAFKVKERDAKIALTSEKGITTDNAYLISLGNKKQRKVTIRDSKSNTVLGQSKVKKVPNRENFSTYWISYENGLIEIGEGSEKGQNLIMQCNVPEDMVYPINFIAVSSGEKTDGGEWQFIHTGDEPTVETAKPEKVPRPVLETHKVSQEIQLVMEKLPPSTVECKTSNQVIELKAQIRELPSEERQSLLRTMVEAALNKPEEDEDVTDETKEPLTEQAADTAQIERLMELIQEVVVEDDDDVKAEEICHTEIVQNVGEYCYLPEVLVTQSSWIPFRVRAKKDAKMILLPHTTDSPDDQSYTISIGTDDNSKTSIKDGYNGNVVAESETREILSTDNFNQFWVSWDDGKIKVGNGRSKNEKAVLTYEIPDQRPLVVKQIAVATGDDSKGGAEWQFLTTEFEPSKTTHLVESSAADTLDITPQSLALTITDNYFAFKTLKVDVYRFLRGYPVASLTWIPFGVKAAGNASVALTPAQGETHENTYEIVLGGWYNTKSEISDSGMIQEETITKDILSHEEFRFFWISWENGKIQVGKGKEKNKEVFMEWQVPEGELHPINAMAVSIGDMAGGEWRFPKLAGKEAMTPDPEMDQAFPAFTDKPSDSIAGDIGQKEVAEDGATEKTSQEIVMSPAQEELSQQKKSIKEDAPVDQGIVTWVPVEEEPDEIDNYITVSTQSVGEYRPIESIDLTYDTWTTFNVKSDRGACVALSSTPDISKETSYRIILGAAKNTETIVQESGSVVAEEATPGILSEQEYRHFWVSWEDYILRVGRGFKKDQKEILNWAIPESKRYFVKYIAIKTSQTPGEWAIRKPEERTQEEQPDDEPVRAPSVEKHVTFEESQVTEQIAEVTNDEEGTENRIVLEPRDVPPTETFVAIETEPEEEYFFEETTIIYERWSVFRVQAESDARLAVTTIRGNSRRDAYEIILGAFDNTKTLIKEGGEIRAEAATENILYDEEARLFWVSWDGGFIQIGRGWKKGENVILEWEAPEDKIYNITSMSVTTGRGKKGRKGRWEFVGWKDEWGRHHGSYQMDYLQVPYSEEGYISESEESEIAYDMIENFITVLTPAVYDYQLLPEVSVNDKTWLTFRLKAGCHGHLALSSVYGETDSKTYEIIIGAERNTKSQIRNGGHGQIHVEAYTTGILSENRFKNFWISWDNNKIQVGRGMRRGRRQFLEWDIPPENRHSVNSLAVATAEGSDGTWEFVELIDPDKMDDSKDSKRARMNRARDSLLWLAKKQRMLNFLEDVYPNSMEVADLIRLMKFKPSDLITSVVMLKELADRGLIREIEPGVWMRTSASVAEEQHEVKVVKEVPQLPKKDQPVIAIITALYCEKVAVDTMIDNKVTYVRHKTAGEASVYTIGNIGPHLVVSTKLSKVGSGRDAMISAGSSTTRLLGTFNKIQHVLLVGVAGGVPHYSDFFKHIRLGDVAVSMPYVENGPFFYHCDKIEREGDDDPPKFSYITRQWVPRDMTLISIAQQFFAMVHKNPMVARPWEQYIMEGEQKLRGEESSFHRPSVKTDKLYMLENGEKIHIKHPKPPRGAEFLYRENQPTLRYGIITSGRPITRSQDLRSEFAEASGTIAFNLDYSPVLESIEGNRTESFIVIRGVCDYEDGSKKKEWQPYASLCAAAYMKAMILMIPQIQ